MIKYNYEYTHTFAGEANYSWVKRGTVSMPELTHYGYDGGTNYNQANKVFQRELMRKVKAELGMTGYRGRKENWGDCIAFYPYGYNSVLFITFDEESE